MGADQRMVELFSYYRDAELHGAGLLLQLTKWLRDDLDAQVNLAMHVAQETHHAWLWTEHISKLEGQPTPVQYGRSPIDRHPTPETLIELLALSVVVEERSLARYQEHSRRPNVDPQTRQILSEVTKGERWYISWIRRKLDFLATEQNATKQVNATLERYRAIDEEAYSKFQQREAANTTAAMSAGL